ncbi:hypothetical protein E2C01_092911 [Portunus trituberculatus]|uniref:Uncharacterized protein n=1 Tax=Portunus trituberculatus TaxID=210409 RepID=A0A5B7JLI4_PORTR|nr:hypothetical protein [Portunus trituberculatus]
METEILAELRLLRGEVAALRRENMAMRELIERRVPQGTPDSLLPDEDEMWWEEEGAEPSALGEPRTRHMVSGSPTSSAECGWSTDSGSLCRGKAVGVVTARPGVCMGLLPPQREQKSRVCFTGAAKGNTGDRLC